MTAREKPNSLGTVLTLAYVSVGRGQKLPENRVGRMKITGDQRIWQVRGF